MEIKYNDAELVALITADERSAFNYLYRNYSVALLRTIQEIVSDYHSTEDILQETFIATWKNIHKYDSLKGCFYTWMRCIAKNKAIDFLRSSVSSMQRKSDSLEEITHQHMTTEMLNKTDHIGIAKQVDALTLHHRSLLGMVYYGGYTFEEAAQALDMPLGTVKSRIRRALQLLRVDFNMEMRMVK